MILYRPEPEREAIQQTHYMVTKALRDPEGGEELAYLHLANLYLWAGLWDTKQSVATWRAVRGLRYRFNPAEET